MRRTLRSGATGAALGVLIAIALVGCSGSTSQTLRAKSQSPTIVAQWSSPATNRQPVIEEISPETGRLLLKVQPLPGWPSTVTGPFGGTAGTVLYSTSTGPRYRSNVAGGDPAPRSCASVIKRLDLATGASRRLLAFPDSQLAAGSIPSPDGSRLAFMVQGCQDYLNWHYVVRDLRSGREIEIGGASPPCHAASAPSWSSDGRFLALTWGPSILPVGAPPTRGGCPQWRASELAIVPTDRNIPLIDTGLHPADPGCGYEATAFDQWGLAAVQTCGPLGLGSASFIQFDRSLRPLLRFDLPRFADGVTLSAQASTGPVVIDEYQAPDHTTTEQPTEWLFLFDGKALHTLIRDHSGVDSITFATLSAG